MLPRQHLDRLIKDLGNYAPAGYAVYLHIRATRAQVLHVSYPQAWVRHYIDNGYALRDPAIAGGYRDDVPLRWSDLNRADPAGIMTAASGFGLCYGMVAGCGAPGSRSVVSLARTDREFADTELANVATILDAMHAATSPAAALTPAQAEALRLIASGNRNAAAADKLGISESALKMRLNSARKRLLARTTAEAIQRARDGGLI